MVDSKDLTQSPSARRRRVLWGVAAGLAGAAGLGLSLRQAKEADLAVADPVPGFWAQEWQTPQDTTLSMAGFKGRPVLVNFWATWCPPCVDELPLLDSFHKEQGSRGVQVLGLAIDRKEAVLPFLQKLPLSFPVAMAGLSGADLGRALGNITGGLPFSVLVASDGSVAQRKMGRVSSADLAAWAAVK
nr:TlpA disulfide reductase family protein [uncultured Rhodoferax sp.]